MTACVPPFADSEYELPSLPVKVTLVAFVAVTVRVDELPDVTDVGFAMMAIVDAGFDVTVTVALAVALPPVPTDDAVYVVVTVGVTICVPPLAGKEYELPSLPDKET